MHNYGAGLIGIAFLLSSFAVLAAQEDAGPTRPNIVYILADDLGYNELGCYGQTKIRTPNLDALAHQGMRFTQHYSGSPVCAPSRCVLLTGLHTGRSYIRGNKEMGGWGPDEPEGQLPLPADTPTISKYLRSIGYKTAVVGKWGLGGPGSTGHPNHQGFDFFYGYLCQRVAHNYYPTHLWRNHDVDVLDGNRYFRAHQKLSEEPDREDAYEIYSGEVYAPDRMIEEALKFVERNRQQPFFLYFASPVPHAAIQVPKDSLEEYWDKFEDTAYLGKKAYLPHPQPRAGYAAMVTRLDRDIGRIVDLLERLGLRENTLIFFSSDNGPTFNGGSDSEFFESNKPFRGLKGSVYEGGLRVPMIANWPGRIAAGAESDHPSGFQDLFPTLVEITGGLPAQDWDGISFAPTLLGEPGQAKHAYMYWEYPEADGQQAVLFGSWKLVRRNLRKGKPRLALYDLSRDLQEARDLSAEFPDVVTQGLQFMQDSHRASVNFPIPALDTP